MAWRYHGRAEVDPSYPRAFGICDRCGFLYNLHTFRFQPIYAGPGMINTNILVCDRCYDIPNPNLQTIVLPPDPMPVFNARPEPYFLDEVDILSSNATTGIAPSEDAGGIATNNASENFSEPPGE